MSETEDVVAEDVAHLLEQAERRQIALKEHLRVAVQNWEVFAQDYAAHINGLSREIDQNGLVIHRLHSMKLGRTADPPMSPVTAKKERSAEQEKLRAIFEDGRPPPPPEERTVPVVLPEGVERAKEGFTTWTYTAGKDWGPIDPIDEKNVRHVQAIICPEGHFNPLNKTECLTCKKEIDLKKADRYYRLYDMTTGKLIESEIVAKANGVTETVPS